MNHLLLELWVHAHVHVALAGERLTDHLAARRADERGQTTAEYALVLLGAGLIAMLVIVWAKKTDRIGKLLDAVVGNVTDKAKSE